MNKPENMEPNELVEYVIYLDHLYKLISNDINDDGSIDPEILKTAMRVAKEEVQKEECEATEQPEVEKSPIIPAFDQERTLNEIYGYLHGESDRFMNAHNEDIHNEIIFLMDDHVGVSSRLGFDLSKFYGLSELAYDIFGGTVIDYTITALEKIVMEDINCVHSNHPVIIYSEKMCENLLRTVDARMCIETAGFSHKIAMQLLEWINGMQIIWASIYSCNCVYTNCQETEKRKLRYSMDLRNTVSGWIESTLIHDELRRSQSFMEQAVNLVVTGRRLESVASQYRARMKYPDVKPDNDTEAAVDLLMRFPDWHAYSIIHLIDRFSEYIYLVQEYIHKRLLVEYDARKVHNDHGAIPDLRLNAEMLAYDGYAENLCRIAKEVIKEEIRYDI